MTDSEWLREALHRDAASMRMPTAMPVAVQKAIRRRRMGAFVGALGIIAVVAIGAIGVVGEMVRDGDRSGDVAGEGSRRRVLRAGVTEGGVTTSNPRVIGRGKDGGVGWELVLSDAPNGPCLELQLEHQARHCEEIGGGSFASGFAVYPGFAANQQRAYLIGTIPEDASGVSISLRGGGQWAGLIFKGPPGVHLDYFVRVFPTAEVSGIIRQGSGGPPIEFEVEQRDGEAITRADIADSDALPGFEDVPGETTVIHTDPLGDSVTRTLYDVVLRTTDRVVCLHVEDEAKCAPRSGLTDGVRLATVHPVGVGAVVAGLVGPDVEEVVIESVGGDRYPQELLPVRQAGLAHRYFVTPVEASFRGDIVVSFTNGNARRIPVVIE
jgi:hypothetical protein